MTNSQTAKAAILALTIITLGGAGGGGSFGPQWQEPTRCYAITDTGIIGPWAPRADGACHVEDANGN